MNLIVFVIGVIFTIIVCVVMFFYFKEDPAPNFGSVQKAGEPCTAGIIGCESPAYCVNGVCKLGNYSDCNNDTECESNVCAGGKICLDISNKGDSIFSAPDPVLGCIGIDLELDYSGTMCLVKAGATCSRSEECVSNVCGADGVCATYRSLGDVCNGVCDYPLVCSKNICQSPGYTSGSPGSFCNTGNDCDNKICKSNVCSFSSPVQTILEPCGTNNDCLSKTCTASSTSSRYCNYNYFSEYGFINSFNIPCKNDNNNCYCTDSSNIFQFDFQNAEFSKLKNGLSNFKYFDYNSDFMVSDGITVNYSGKSFPVPTLPLQGKTLYDIKLNPNGNIYYFFLNKNNTVSYIVNGVEIKVIDGYGNFIEFEDPSSYKIIISVGNNIIIGQENKTGNLVLYANFNNQYFDIYDDSVVGFFQNIIPLNVFQITPLEIYVLYIYNSYIILKNIDINGLVVTEVFRTPQNNFKNTCLSSMSVYNNVERLVLYDNTNGIFYLENFETQKATYLPVNYSNALLKLDQDKIYMISDKICS